LVYHDLRANARLRIFHKDDDYAAWERILAEAIERFEMRVLAY
jgi:putative transposase